MSGFRRGGSSTDLDEAIRSTGGFRRSQWGHRAAPPSHHSSSYPGSRSSDLSNLAIAVHERFQHRGNSSDIEEAIKLHRESLALLPPPHPHRGMSLNNLAIALYHQAQQRGHSPDIDEAIQMQREGLVFRPPSSVPS
ncbi:hypothetical protein B0H13DRAFT_2266978 [Mycena leptocephala]|nr:hypothetical protein B0H13DRAFT_2266978 [Mycena leptocephala]